MAVTLISKLIEPHYPVDGGMTAHVLFLHELEEECATLVMIACERIVERSLELGQLEHNIPSSSAITPAPVAVLLQRLLLHTEHLEKTESVIRVKVTRKI